MTILLGFLMFLVSIVFAMMGLGGGMVHMPLLLWFGYPLKSEAQPIALLLNGVTALTATVTYARKSMIDWRVALPMAGVTLVAALFGSITAKYIPDNILIILFTVIIFIVLLRTLLSLRSKDIKNFSNLDKRHLAIAMAAALVIAFISSMIGLGGGSLIVPVLIWLSYPTKRAAALSSFLVAVSSVSAFVGRIGNLHASWTLIIFLVAAVVLGAALGSRLMVTKIKPEQIKYGYSIFMVGIAVKLILPLI